MSRDALRAAYYEFRDRGGILDLCDRLKLAFTGGDRLRYINGQVTANIAGATTGKILPACVTTAKGKLCADVFVSVLPEVIVVDSERALADSLPPRLERYIVADDVEMADVTHTAGLIHAAGISPETLTAVSGRASSSVHRLGIAGADLLSLTSDEHTFAWEKLSAEFPVISGELAEIIRLEQGIPHWGSELDENTLPPEAGLDRTHIDFHKGCYIGQEVISRIKSLGHVNRELVGFVADAPLSPGVAVCSKTNLDQPAGTITSAGWSFALERPIALGYLRRTAAHGELFARSAEPGSEPVAITISALPFTK